MLWDHWWVGALVQFNFELQYQKGHDNTVANALSWVTTSTGPKHSEINPWWNDIGKCMLGWSSWPHHSWGWLLLGARGMCHCILHLCTNTCYCLGWSPERGHMMLSTVLDWLKAQKKTDLKAILAEHASSKEGQLILHNWQNLIIHQEAL